MWFRVFVGIFQQYSWGGGVPYNGESNQHETGQQKKVETRADIALI